MKKFITNLSLIAGGFISLYLAYITGTGEILNYVPFADPLNEMAFFGVSIMMGSGCFIAVASK
jgi:hypothetical protein